jgi:hypothetical protein
MKTVFSLKRNENNQFVLEIDETDIEGINFAKKIIGALGQVEGSKIAEPSSGRLVTALSHSGAWRYQDGDNGGGWIRYSPVTGSEEANTSGVRM